MSENDVYNYTVISMKLMNYNKKLVSIHDNSTKVHPTLIPME